MKASSSLFCILFLLMGTMPQANAQSEQKPTWDIGAAAVIPNFGLDDIVELGIGAQIGLAFDLSGPWSGRFDVSYLRFSPHDTNMGIVDYTIFPAQLGMDRSLGAGDTAPLLGLRLGAYLLEGQELPLVAGAWGAASGGRFSSFGGSIGIAMSKPIFPSFALKAQCIAQSRSGVPSWDFGAIYTTVGVQYSLF